LPQFVEQVRVLDSDNSLRGEGLYQFDLFVSGRFYLGASYCDRTDRLIAPKHGDGQNRLVAKPMCHRTAIWVLLGKCEGVVDMNCRSIRDRTTRDPATSNRPIAKIQLEWSVVRSDVQSFALAQKNGIVCVAVTAGGLYQRVKNGLQIERR
jgi:hypothetical protein